LKKKDAPGVLCNPTGFDRKKTRQRARRKEEREMTDATLEPRRKVSKRRTASIINKLNTEGGFCRHLNGNTTDNRASNLSWVTLREAIDHFDDWTTDICCFLSQKEYSIVADPAWRAHLKWN
jgi:hypothetical protein